MFYLIPTSPHRGFGFVVFESKSTMDEVLKDGVVHTIDNKEVDTKKAIPHARHQVREGGREGGGEEGTREGGERGY